MPNDAAEVLAQQFERDSEAWKPQHDAVKLCNWLEDFIQVGLRHFRAIRDEDQAWSRRVQSGAATFDAKIARYLRGRYEWWYKPCQGVIDCIRVFEDYGLVVDGSEEFRKATATVRAILATPIDDVVSGMEAVASGQYETL